MSEPRAATGPFFVAGGTLRPGTPSYITRQADAELYERLLAGDFCYVLTARQMGKSSLMASTAKRLEGERVRTAIVDLTQIGTERGAAEANQWYFGVAYEIHKKLGITEPLRSWWQERADLPAVQRLTEFFRELVLGHCPGKVVVFVDEIDSTIGLPFADDFFAAIRACYNARAIEPDFERLTFVLLGVASPDQLIQDPTRTPFNVGHRIDLTDFSLEEACPLAAGLHTEPEVAAQRLERVFHWTGGHPYLIQSLCRAVEEKCVELARPEAIVDPFVETLFLSSLAQREETNLKHVRARLAQEGAAGRRLLRLYLRVREGKKVRDEPTSFLFAQLKLAGVVKVGGDGNLAVRNRIYEAVFTPQWVRSEMPSDRGLQLAAAVFAATLIGLLFYYEVSYPRIYVRQLEAATESDAYEVAEQAYGKLSAIPFWKSRADELLAKFWDHRALQQAVLDNRDESLLSRLKAIGVKDTPRRRKEAQALVGDDYADLLGTFRSPTRVAALAFSPDGRNVLAAGWDGSVRSWSREGGRSWEKVKSTGRELEPGKFSRVRFGADGRTLLTLDRQGRLEKRDIEADRLVESSSAGTPNNFGIYLDFSQDGRYILGVSRGWQIWDREAKRSLDLPSAEALNSISGAFNVDGKMVAISVGYVRIWSVETQQFLGSPLRHKSVTALQFSQDGQLVLAGDLYGRVHLWNWKTGNSAGPPLLHGQGVTSLAMSPDNGMLLTGGADRIVRMWKNLGNPPPGLSIREGRAHGARFSAKDPGLLVVGKDGTIGLQESSGEPPRPLWRTAADSQLYLDSDRQFVLEVTDTAARLRVAATGRLACLFPKEPALLRFAQFSRDGKTVVVFDSQGGRLWNTRTCQPIASFSGEVVRVVFSTDGQWLAVIDSRDTVKFLDVRLGRSVGPALNLPVRPALMAFSQDGQVILVGDEYGGVRLWSRSMAKPLSPLIKSIEGIRAAEFRPDGRGFIVATDHWLYSFSLNGSTPRLRGARLLRGTWMGAFRFVPGCDDCLEVAQGYSDSFFVETIHFDEPDNPPIQGTPKELLAHWQKVLGLQFDGKTGAFLPL